MMDKRVTILLFSACVFLLGGCVESKKNTEEAPVAAPAKVEHVKPSFDPNALQEVYTYLSESQPFFISTVDGDQPRVRPFGFSMLYDGKLYFATGTAKEIAAQLQANPAVEITAVSKEGGWIRVRGKAVFDTSIQAKTKAFELSPSLKGIYNSPDSPTFAVFYLTDGEVSFNSFTAESRIVSF